MTEFNDTEALLLLNTIDGIRLKRRHALLAIARPGELLTRIDYYREKIVGIIGSDLFEKLKDALRRNLLGREKDDLYKHGITAISVYDARYPENLKEIYEFPALLYCKGDISLLKKRGISVVGTRNASRYGLNVTRDFVTEFSRAGLNVTSGFARGIDTMAHKSALDAEGSTTAVIASGLDICYPAENRSLEDRILKEGGLFVSEYRLGTAPAQFNFPERNRIISGLSEALFVPETRIKSGTMITVNHAVEQGKDIFIVPANINQPSAEGSNLLLKQMQGALVLSPDDVLDEMGVPHGVREQKETLQLNIYEMKILEILEKSEAHFEELIAATGLNANELQNVVFNMEMNDLIERTSGNYFTLK